MTKRAGYVRNICAAVGVSLAISTGLASTAGAAPTTLPLTSFNDMVVDAQNEHVFVTGGLADQSVVVLDFQGNIITTIGNQNGAAGLVLDETSSTLYVALRGSREISRISTTSLTELGRFSVAPAAPPRALALAAGRLWISGCGDESDFASITPAGEDLRHHDGACLLLAASPTDPGVLTAGQLGGSSVTVYDVTGAEPTKTVSGPLPGDFGYGGGNLQDLAVSADGLRVLPAAGFPYFHQALSMTDLARVAKYDSSAYPNAVAVSPDGRYVAGGVYDYYGTDVYIFPAGSQTASRTHAFGFDSLYVGGLAFSPNGRKVFAIFGASDSAPRFHVLSNRVLTALTLAAPKTTLTHGQSVTITARLTPLEAGSQQVSIYATPYGGTKTLVKRGRVDSAGVLRATVKPKKKTTYTATFNGDVAHEAATAKALVVAVRVIARTALAGGYGTSGRDRLYRLGQAVQQTGTVEPNHSGKSLRFVAQRRVNGAWKTIATARFRIGRSGSATAFFNAASRGSYRSRNEFAGDADHVGNVSPWRYFRVA